MTSKQDFTDARPSPPKPSSGWSSNRRAGAGSVASRTPSARYSTETLAGRDLVIGRDVPAHEER